MSGSGPLMADPERGPAGTWQHLAFWRDGRIDLNATFASLPADDMHAAFDIAASREGELHYTPGNPGTWYIWDGTCHRPDSSHRAERIIIGYAVSAQQVLDACQGEIRRLVTLQLGPGTDAQAVRRAADTAWKPWEQRVKYIAGLRRSAGASSLLRYLSNICAVSEDELAERHPHWLNFRNGTVDLETSELRGHDPADMITYCLDADYRPVARAPRYWSLLSRSVGNDPAVAEYLLTVLGYSMIGANPQQGIWFISGPTSSGKSVLLNVTSQVLGPLAHESQAGLITVVRHGRNARTENSIRGRRLVLITETSAFMTIDEGQLKRITGEAWISVDQHYAKSEIKTPVTWTIVLATNQMPVLTNFDDAMRRRVTVIPGGPTIPAELRDERLAARITAEEREGVLALLVAGCRRYFRDGLPVPEAVAAKTAGYAAEQNTVANFIADCCLVTGGITVSGAPVAISQPAAWRMYEQWSRGSSRLGRREFFDHLEAHPGVTHNETMRRFEGLCWTDTSRAMLNGDGS
jgi:putative DNA primase/helicase